MAEVSPVTLSLRNLVRRAAFVVPNLIGLVAATVSMLLVVQIVAVERAYERWLPNAERIALVSTAIGSAGQEPRIVGTTPVPLATKLANGQGGILAAGRMVEQEADLIFNGVGRKVSASLADPAMAEILDLPVAAGSLVDALNSPRSIVMGADLAVALYGSTEAAMGQSVQVRIRGVVRPYSIAAVLRPPSGPTHLWLDMLIPAASVPELAGDGLQDWLNVTVRTYILLNPSVQASSVGRQIDEAIQPIFEARVRAAGARISMSSSYKAIPLLSLRLGAPELHDDMAGRIGDAGFLVILGLICVGGLALAAFNFAALTAALAATRNLEFALLRTLGASRAQIARDRFLEALVLVGGCLVLAWPVSVFAAGALRSLIGLDPFGEGAGGLHLVLAMAVIWLVLSAAGAFGASMAGTTKMPAQVLAAGGSAARLRGTRAGRWLLAVQYAAACVILATLMAALFSFLAERRIEPGFEASGLYILDTTSAADPQRTADLAARLSAVYGDEAVATGTASPISSMVLKAPVMRPGLPPVIAGRDEIGSNWLQVFGAKLLAGRPPSVQAKGASETRPLSAGAATPVMINDAARAALGFASASEALGALVTDAMTGNELLAVGVVEDVKLTGGGESALPTIYRAESDPSPIIAVRADGPEEQIMTRLEAIWLSAMPDVPSVIDSAPRLLDLANRAQITAIQALAVFAALAVLTALLGSIALSGVMAKAASREMAIRRMVGAGRSQVALLSLWRGIVPVMAGVLIGIPVAVGLMTTGWVEVGSANTVVAGIVLSAAGLLALAVAATAAQAVPVALDAPLDALRKG